MATQIKYVDYEALGYYDSKVKAFIATADAEVLARAGVSIEIAETPTDGFETTYLVFQNYTETVDPSDPDAKVKVKTQIGKIDIPFNQFVDAGSLVVTPATDDEDAKAEIVLTIANTEDDTTVSGKKEVRVDISAVAGDIADVVARVEALEATHATKEDEDGKEVFQTVLEEITANAKDGVYKTVHDEEADTDVDVTIEQAIKALEDATLDVDEYYGDTLAVDVINRLTADVETDGSVLKQIYVNAAEAKYDEVLVDDEQGRKPGEDGYVETKADRTIREKIEALDNEAKVVVKKLDSAEDGYFASYVVEQNGEAVGDKINIPKDFLVKSAEIKTADQDIKDKDDNVLVPAGHQYIDFTVNAKEGASEESHIYLDVKDLVEDFTVKSAADVAADGDEIQLAISDERELSATIVDTSIAREKINADFEADLAAIEAAIGTITVEDEEVLYSVANRIHDEAKDAYYKTVQVEDENGDPVDKEVTIAEAIAALEAASSDTNGAFVLKGSVASVANLPADAKKGDAYQVADEKALYVKDVDNWVRVANEGSFSVGDDDKAHVVDIKTYIDSRIFIGTKEEVDAAKEAGTIDSKTLVIVTDDEASEMVPILSEDIDKLFD